MSLSAASEAPLHAALQIFSISVFCLRNALFTHHVRYPIKLTSSKRKCRKCDGVWFINRAPTSLLGNTQRANSPRYPSSLCLPPCYMCSDAPPFSADMPWRERYQLSGLCASPHASPFASSSSFPTFPIYGTKQEQPPLSCYVPPPLPRSPPLWVLLVCFNIYFSSPSLLFWLSLHCTVHPQASNELTENTPVSHRLLHWLCFPSTGRETYHWANIQNDWQEPVTASVVSMRGWLTALFFFHHMSVHHCGCEPVDCCCSVRIYWIRLSVNETGLINRLSPVLDPGRAVSAESCIA